PFLHFAVKCRAPAPVFLGIDHAVVVPLAVLVLEFRQFQHIGEGNGAVHSHFILLTLASFTGFGSDDQCAVGCTGAVQCSGCRAFQHRYGLDVLRVDIITAVTEVNAAAAVVATNNAGVVNGHTVYHQQCLVVTGNGRTATDHDPGGAVRRKGA